MRIRVGASPLARGACRTVVTCPHGSTVADVLEGSRRLVTVRQLVTIAVARHRVDEGCDCRIDLPNLNRSSNAN